MTLRDTLFSFEGRLRRRDWWLWGIAAGTAWTAMFTPAASAVFDISLATSLLGGVELPRSWSFTDFGLVTFAPLLWVQSALAAKRAHDRNKGAAIALSLTILAGLLSFVVEIADLVLGTVLSQAQFVLLSASVNAVVMAMHLYLLITLGFLDGTPGPNRFGPSPKRLSGGAPAFMAPGGLE